MSLMANFTEIGGLGKEIDIGNTTIGEDWNMKGSTVWPLRIEEESTVGMAAESMKEMDSAVEIDTKIMKDVRV